MLLELGPHLKFYCFVEVAKHSICTPSGMKPGMLRYTRQAAQWGLFSILMHRPIRNVSIGLCKHRRNLSVPATTLQKPYYITTPIFYVNAGMRPESNHSFLG